MQNNAAISAGQWWRLITPAFLHMNLIHLAVNSMALHSLGAEVERFSDRGRFLAIYTISVPPCTQAGSAWAAALMQY